MLRSIQTLRETSDDAQIVSAEGGQLALVGGGDAYSMPWHWHDGLMILLPRMGALGFRDETRTADAWLSEDRFVVVPKMMSHQTAARRAGHDHLAIYATDDLGRDRSRPGIAESGQGQTRQTVVLRDIARDAVPARALPSLRPT